MKESRLSTAVEPLRELLHQSDMIIRGFSERASIKVMGLTCDCLPVEVLDAGGFAPLRIPAHNREGTCCCGATGSMTESPYDVILAPECGDGGGSEPEGVIRYRVPRGYGEEHSSELDRVLERILEVSAPGTGKPDPGKLRESVEKYNILRRLIRGTTARRRTRPWELSNRDLFTLFEAAAALPVESVIEHIAGITKQFSDEPCDECTMIPALVHAGTLTDASVLDDIEEAGCLVAEDDMCNGRRQFDMSFNADSPDLYGEILDASSYRPFCPGVRPPEERYELLYRMLKGHEIETVIFITDRNCRGRAGEIEYLRVRLMRDGVDPLLINSASAFEEVRDYVVRSLA